MVNFFKYCSEVMRNFWNIFWIYEQYKNNDDKNKFRKRYIKHYLSFLSDLSDIPSLKFFMAAPRSFPIFFNLPAPNIINTTTKIINNSLKPGILNLLIFF